jgi:omega-6 fatty acid desaturase (delta-12 desaturase)
VIQVDVETIVPQARTESPDWSETIARFRHADLRKGNWQVLTSIPPFFLFWYLMYLCYQWSYLFTLLLAFPTAGFLVRIFIIQHDCGHHSFFHRPRPNDILGCVCGVLTMTPYHFWRRMHARHHVTSGNLDHRGHGDVGLLTVREYRARSCWGRFGYRLYRNPFFMFVFGASFMFLVQHRFTRGIPASWRRERMSVYSTNAALLAIFTIACATIGWRAFVLIELPVAMLGAAAGSWLFYVQHQYEEAYWQPHESWDFTHAALKGSSYYRLPIVLRWFSGNIGYHHIHHLNSRIPNYHLRSCYAAEPAFRQVATFGIRDSFKCLNLKLWDEDRQRMVTFVQAR